MHDLLFNKSCYEIGKALMTVALRRSVDLHQVFMENTLANTMRLLMKTFMIQSCVCIAGIATEVWDEMNRSVTL